jgi:hypothetical protein
VLYDTTMRAFICEIDHRGLRRLTPEEFVGAEELRRLARGPVPQSAALWALLDERDAEDLRSDFDAGRLFDACALLLNRAVELLSVAAAGLPSPTPADRYPLPDARHGG